VRSFPRRFGPFALTLLLAACTTRPTDDEEETPTPGDDDDSAADDDDATADDDDATVDPPVFLASYDFSLVLLKNLTTGVFQAVHGEMDVYVSTTQFRSVLTTTGGLEWEWLGALIQNEQSFDVFGPMQLPNVPDFYVDVAGNFLRGVGGTPSDSCLTGIGRDNDAFSEVPAGVEFAWYACRADASPTAIDRTGTYAVSVIENGDNCNGWNSSSWTEQWQFQGRKLIVTRGGAQGWGVVSDDGQIFRFSMLESTDPGKSLKVIGDFTSPTGTEEAIATGHCSTWNDILPGAVFDLDYP
jgi:hypothetical protein